MGGQSKRYFLGLAPIPDKRIHIIPVDRRAEWDAWKANPSLHTVGLSGTYCLNHPLESVEFATPAWPGKKTPPFTVDFRQKLADQLMKLHMQNVEAEINPDPPIVE